MQILTPFIAGDTVSATGSYHDYSSLDGWSSTIYFNGPTNFNVTGSAGSSGEYLFTIPSNKTAFAKAGTYDYYIRLTSGSISQTVETGVVTIYANPALVVSKEQIATRMIELIEKALYNQLSTGEAVESISIAGRSLSMMNRTDLLNERAFWNRELKAIRNARTGNAGITQIKIEI